MEYGICSLAAITCKAESNHKAEQINQLLFGEIYSVLEKTADWYKIKTDYDSYEGWIHRKHHTGIEEEIFSSIASQKSIFSGQTFGVVNELTNQFFCNIPLGSTLPFFHQSKFNLGGSELNYSGLISEQKLSNCAKYSQMYLNTPYLWGGRTPMGIDCSGMVQMTFKLCGIKLLRDSKDQATQGILISNLSQAQEGDLVFFGDETKINHVGMLLDNSTVIHASGKVKIEQIDATGIIGNIEKDYTHYLKLIKRVG